MSGECRIGSVAWLAGLFWLGVSGAALEAARLAARAGWLWGAQRGAWVTCWAAGLATACAKEGGAE